MMNVDAEKRKIEDVLKEKGVYIGPTVGVSMLPMLKNRRDTIVVKPKTERLKRLDVALYKRGESYILHRVLEAVDGGYIIRGDNCYVDENVPEEAVIGVLTEFFRKDKHILCTDKKYIRYAEKRIKTYKSRRFFVRMKRNVRAFGGKVLRKLRLRK
ncbi:MAG: hypothetical protein J6B56_05120 [Clostridia bacterium]|nr:hypothetical protein [Clostridia bacterium]